MANFAGQVHGGTILKVLDHWRTLAPAAMYVATVNVDQVMFRERIHVGDFGVERKYAGGKFDRLPGLARELVQGKVDVILAAGTFAIQSAKAATTTIPIVFLNNVDPVDTGLVASLAKPGANSVRTASKLGLFRMLQRITRGPYLGLSREQ